MTLTELTTHLTADIKAIAYNVADMRASISGAIAESIVEYAAPKSTLVTDDGTFFGVGYTSDPTSGNKAGVNGPMYVGGAITAVGSVISKNAGEYMASYAMHQTMNYMLCRSVSPDATRAAIKFQQQINGTSTVYEIGQFDAAGNLVLNGSVLVGNDSTAASAVNDGAIRYRISGTTSYCEMCMKTGASTWAWVVIKSNTW